MALEIINIGTTANDGTGDPLRTAFAKCNTNFGQIYGRYRENPPSTNIGTAGDVAGMYSADSIYFYYCFQDYDGSSVIWGRMSNTW